MLSANTPADWVVTSAEEIEKFWIDDHVDLGRLL
jgi:hypothetical protein